MVRTARAAVFEGANKPFVMREYPIRRPEAGEVLVKVSMSTICRSDIHTWEGKRHNHCPSILGHEIIGVIDAIRISVQEVTKARFAKKPGAGWGNMANADSLQGRKSRRS